MSGLRHDHHRPLCSQILFHRVAACACGFLIRVDDRMSSGTAEMSSGKADPAVAGAD